MTSPVNSDTFFVQSSEKKFVKAVKQNKIVLVSVFFHDDETHNHGFFRSKPANLTADDTVHYYVAATRREYMRASRNLAKHGSVLAWDENTLKSVAV